MDVHLKNCIPLITIRWYKTVSFVVVVSLNNFFILDLFYEMPVWTIETWKSRFFKEFQPILIQSKLSSYQTISKASTSPKVVDLGFLWPCSYKLWEFVVNNFFSNYRNTIRNWGMLTLANITFETVGNIRNEDMSNFL